MHWFFMGLIFHIGFQSAISVHHKVLLKSENADQSQTIFGLADVEFSNLGLWTFKISRSEIVSKAQDGVLETAVTTNDCWMTTPKKLQFQFVTRDKILKDLFAKPSQFSWIEATVHDRVPLADNIFSITIFFHLTTFVKFFPNNPMGYYGYGIQDGEIMLMVSDGWYSNFQVTFEDQNWFTLQLLLTVDKKEKPSTILLEFADLAEAKITGYTIVFMKYWEIEISGKQTSMVLKDGNRKEYLIANCYFKFSNGGFPYTAFGQIKYSKGDATGTMWIEKVWIVENSIYKRASEKIGLFDGIRTCEVAMRSNKPTVSYKKLGKSLTSKQWITLNVEIALHVHPISQHVVGTFNFGTPKIMSYGRDNKISTTFVFQDEGKKLLTLMDPGLTNFESYRATTSKAKTILGIFGSNSSSPEDVDVQLFEAEDVIQNDPNTLATGEKANTKLRIPCSIKANVGTKNPFGFPIFQYNYT